MIRRMPALVAVALVLCVLASGLLAQPPASPEPKAVGELKSQQEQNADLFRKFQRELLSLAQRLERSDRPEDKERAKVIYAALDLAKKENLDSQFAKMIAAMARGSGNVQDVQGIIGQDAQLTKALQEILNVLLTDDEATRIKAEIAKLEAFLKEAREIKRNQETIRAITEAQKGDPNRIAKSQGDLADRTKDLGDKMDGKKPGDKDGKDGKGGEKAIANAEPKPEAKPGDGAADDKAETKEAKAEEKGAPGSDPSKQGGDKGAEAKPGKPMEGAGKETPGKDGEAKDAGDTPGKEGQDPSAEGAGKEGAGKEGAGKEGAGKEGAGKEGAGKEGAGKEGAGKEGAGKEGVGKEGAGKEGAGKEGAGKEGAGKEGAGKEGAGKEGAGKEGAGKEDAGKEGAQTGSKSQAADGKPQGSGKGQGQGKGQEKDSKGKAGDGKGTGAPAGGKDDSPSGSEKGGQEGSSKSGGQDGGKKDGGKKDGGQPGGQSGDEPGGQPGGEQGGQPGGQQQPQQQQTPGRKQVKEAYPHQEGAKDDLKKNDRPNAGKKEDKAIEELAKAIQELEKRLKQLREEELLKLLANLEARCGRMLALQIEVYEATKAIDGIVAKNKNVKTAAEVQKALQQGDKELEIVAEADKTLKLLESEGTAVAFARVLEEVRQDMIAVQRRLADTRVDSETQVIEENIIAILKEMVAALKKSQQDQQQQQQQQQQQSQQQKPQDKNLLDQIAELKLIRSMQIQVNTRTKTQSEKSPGEQAADPLLQSELHQLSARQAKLQDMLNKIATGQNK